MTSLSPHVLAEFRRPFTADAVKFKPQTVKKDKSAALAVFYVDARLVAERLNTVVGIEGWSDEYRVVFEHSPGDHYNAFFPVECRLTVLGLTKMDVGVYAKQKPDVMAMKASYSDSFKRAAVKFGIGASLYACPSVWAPVDTYQRGGETVASGFSAAGKQQLRSAYAKFLAGAGKKAFGDAMDHGDVGSDDATDVEGGSGEDDSPSVVVQPAEGATLNEAISRVVQPAEGATLNEAISRQIKAFNDAEKKDFRDKFERVTGEKVTTVGQAVTTLISEGYTADVSVTEFVTAKLEERTNGNR